MTDPPTSTSSPSPLSFRTPPPAGANRRFMESTASDLAKLAKADIVAQRRRL
ncbi:Putative high-affinity zinc ABC transporter [Bifidobacterium breve]|nr:Putative high-affinity zinc ABC transporter [Bifidobacterium breve]BAQ99545.1 hypothetical protein BBBR_0507 [Bifidobacterium breve DSM 20213 = JCM 1192]